MLRAALDVLGHEVGGSQPMGVVSKPMWIHEVMQKLSQKAVIGQGISSGALFPASPVADPPSLYPCVYLRAWGV